METASWLEEYRALIAGQPTCEDPWFTSTWANYKAGDEYAGRLISGTCLRLAYQLAEKKASQLTEWSLLDLIQEANAGLVHALTSFPGGGASAFLNHATAVIEQHLTSESDLALSGGALHS